MSDDAKVWPLEGNQRPAVDPRETVWLSASAGTGKTQVLSARVLRLLLQGDVAPSQIICLTFTKAGATEMAARINEVLASWVRAKPEALAKDLKAIGADFTPQVKDRARTLFAEVLDCPGGGLRIDTIHAFAQWLLAAFPHEADLTPGVRAMEDRDRALLMRQVLGDLLVDAEQRGDMSTLDALAALSLRLGPDDVEKYLLRCADAHEAWFGTGAWQVPMRPRVNQLLGLAADASEADLAGLCSDQAFDMASLRRCLETLAAWDTGTGREGAAAIGNFLLASPDDRIEQLDELGAALFNKGDGAPKQLNNILKRDPDYEEYILRVSESLVAVREHRSLLQLAEWLTPALELGRSFALAWDEAKKREGFIDFDDQIRRAAELLGKSEMAEWIRYKLDRRFDHILIDEAQDTNVAQWQIINALTGDFFAGEAAHGDKMRTLFVVGDDKQAIFRFQGTSPENFKDARDRVRGLMQGAADNALMLRSNSSVRTLQELDLSQSFRTAQAVLDFVDRAIGKIGHTGFGLSKPPELHVGQKRAGYVAMWRVVGQEVAEAEDAGEDEQGNEGWLARSDRQLADRIARQVRQWMDDGFKLHKDGARRAGPGDVMVLVRKRKELAGLIVARLHAAGVPVAGVDRLRLGAPLAVRDLVAGLRFAAQPLDDLTLANLLVSPLIGWTQEQLLEHGYRPKNVRLWEHLRGTRHRDVAEAMALLLDLLGRADYEPPQALLHWLLVGPWQGRRNLIARLGREANDPIDELLNAANAYAASDTPSLQGFLRWFDAGEGELKREAGKAGGLVRVMTVHGTKGLQAPIVILADAADNPDSSRGGALDLVDPPSEDFDDQEPRRIPLPRLRKDEKLGRIAAKEEASGKADREEHWRLLYVAMTRAEEALFIGGSLSPREKAPAPDSWYARLEGLFGADEWLDDPIWGARLERGEVPLPVPLETGGAELRPASALPAWLSAPPGPEPRPTRPLVPSALGEDIAADPPFLPGTGQTAARRGVLMHKLLERLPELAPDQRMTAAQAWLGRMAGEFDAAERDEMAQAALEVLAHPDWQDLFSPAALAEVPIAALVGTRVVAGTIDRLLVTPDRIWLVDFKTARRPPTALDEVPIAILRQMAAYAAALEASFPGRVVEAALLYTQVPQLIAIPPGVLDRHKQELIAAE
jgi:ATP-dependent helicase/nuclease subunit A